RVTAEAGELRRHVALAGPRRRDDVVAAVASHSARHRRAPPGAHLVPELGRERRHVAEAADPVLRGPVPEGPPPVLEERVTQPERGTEGLVAVFGVLPRVAVEVEPARDGAIEQARNGEADHAMPT